MCLHYVTVQPLHWNNLEDIINVFLNVRVEEIHQVKNHQVG